MWRDWIIKDWVGNIGWSWRRSGAESFQWTETEIAEVVARDAERVAREALIEAYMEGKHVNIFELRKLRAEANIHEWLGIEKERLKRLHDRKMESLIYRGALRLRALQVRAEKQRPIIREKCR